MDRHEKKKRGAHVYRRREGGRKEREKAARRLERERLALESRIDGVPSTLQPPIFKTATLEDSCSITVEWGVTRARLEAHNRYELHVIIAKGQREEVRRYPKGRNFLTGFCVGAAPEQCAFRVGDLEKDKRYIFTVRAGNVRGWGAWSAESFEMSNTQGAHTAAQLPPPGPVPVLRARGATFIHVDWPVSSEPGDTAFNVEMESRNRGAWFSVAKETSASWLKVEGLRPLTDYKFRTFCVTEAGVGPAGEESAKMTTMKGPPPKPTQPTCVDSDATSITIAWHSPHARDDKVQGFHIALNQPNVDRKWEVVATAPRNAECFTVGGLSEGALCKFKVRAFNRKVSSPWSQISGIMTCETPIENIQEALFAAKLTGLDGILKLMKAHPLNLEMQNKCIKTIFAMMKRQLAAAAKCAEDALVDAAPQSLEAKGWSEGLEEFVGTEVKERPTEQQAAKSVQLALEAMRQHKQDPFPQKWGSRIIGLCGVEFDLDDDLINAGIQELLGAMGRFPIIKAVQQWGAEQLLNLCTEKGSSMVVRIADRGAIGVLINSFLFNPGDPTVHTYGCQLLSLMLRQGELYQQEAKLGGLKALMRSARVQFTDALLKEIVTECLEALE